MIDSKQYKNLKILPVHDIYLNNYLHTTDFNALVACSDVLLLAEDKKTFDLIEEIDLCIRYLYFDLKIENINMDWAFKWFLKESEHEAAKKFRELFNHVDYIGTRRYWANPIYHVIYEEDDYIRDSRKAVYESKELIALLINETTIDAFNKYLIQCREAKDVCEV